MKISIAKQRGWIDHGDGTWHTVGTGRFPAPYKEYICKECKELFIADRKQLYCSAKCASVKNINTQNGELNPQWKGGEAMKDSRRSIGSRRNQQSGYIEIWNGTHWVGEHRFVMEMHLSRKLEHKQHVHHINGIKNDNRIENLVVLTTFEHNHIHKAEQVKRFKRNKSGQFVP